jgi:hypothetical protein
LPQSQLFPFSNDRVSVGSGRDLILVKPTMPEETGKVCELRKRAPLFETMAALILSAVLSNDEVWTDPGGVVEPTVL